MYRVLPLIWLCAAGTAYAQNGRMYYNSMWEQTKKKNAAYYREATGSDSLFQVNDYYLTGQLFRSGYRTTLQSECYVYRTGHYVYYDSAGHKLREGDYLKGRRNGTWLSYYTDGNNSISSEQQYRNDSLTGRSYFYDDEPHVLSQEAEYADDRKINEWDYGKDTLHTTYLYNDAGHEEHTTNSKGTLKFKKVYEGYKLTSQECYDDQGVRKACDTAKNDTGVVFKYVEKMPATDFVINDYIAHNIRYPKSARMAGVEGRVIVKFVVGADGTVENVTIKKGIDPECDAEAVRVISEMPAWNPGYQNGKAVMVYYTLPLIFKLK